MATSKVVGPRIEMTGVGISSGMGSPEGVIEGNPGAIYITEPV